MFDKQLFLIFVLALSCLANQRFVAARLVQDEVNALEKSMKTMGSTYWKFDDENCLVEMVGITPDPPQNSVKNITCNCQFQNNTCHVVSMEIKRLNLPGVLPPELVQLPYLERIDFAYNYLNGSIPAEWASLKLTYISLLGNRLSGNIPSHLASFTALTYLDLEVNQFSGTIPSDIGKLVNLETLILSSNQFSGNLPLEFAELRNLTDFRINDNNFNGTIPDYIQNWKQLERLEMYASGLQGPIPTSISVLVSSKLLKISDINGTSQVFPELGNMTGLTHLVLRNCNLFGKIPSYIWRMSRLLMLDLSFNMLSGELPGIITIQNLKFVFLTGNLLSGDIPQSILMQGSNIDLSYNNFTWQSPGHPACQWDIYTDLNLNLFRSSLTENNLGRLLQCRNDFKCSRYWHSLYVNCGGDDVEISGNIYEGDAGGDGGAAEDYFTGNHQWGFSSTGDFMDDNDIQNTRHTENLQSQNIPELYRTARISPLSLTYYRYCMANGSYTVSLHFAEIQYTNDSTYSSLGKRIFDIYMQNELVEKDFNVEAEALGVLTPFIKLFNISIKNNMLEIRLYWAGKGTTRIPTRGIYGPIISAISVDSNFNHRSIGGSTRIAPIVVGAVGAYIILLTLTTIGCYCRGKIWKQTDLKGLDLQTGFFTLKQIVAATNNFDSVNKIGEGGFGPVYRGLLSDGTVIAVKQLSSKSSQGNREFLNEIGVISCLHHPNLVKLYGCCVEGNQLLLVYEYMENNCLSRALFGQENCQIKLDWSTRHRICIGIARGLAFLHEESRLKIVHRDIKGTNILLDKDLNPKISDFGLAKLDEKEKSHISTRIAGTIGYMAPEYAMWGYLTYKADVYSFGILTLEIVSGKQNISFETENKFSCLLDWACHCQQSGNLIELVDERLGSEFNKVEAERMIKIGLLCTNVSPASRPTMSEVLSMLEGSAVIPDLNTEASPFKRDLRFKIIEDHHKQMHNQSSSGSQAICSRPIRLWHGQSSSPSEDDSMKLTWSPI